MAASHKHTTAVHTTGAISVQHRDRLALQAQTRALDAYMIVAYLLPLSENKKMTGNCKFRNWKNASQYETLSGCRRRFVWNYQYIRKTQNSKEKVKITAHCCIRSFMFYGDLHTVAPYNTVNGTDSMAKTEILEDPTTVTAIW
ncbi:hypothetical protein ACJX0J_041441 [Zea mays]